MFFTFWGKGLSQNASIDGNISPINITGFITCQENYYAGNFFGFSYTPHRNCFVKGDGKFRVCFPDFFNHRRTEPGCMELM